jgi:hypothetical protein
MSWLFPAESYSSGGIFVPELVIPGGNPILTPFPEELLFIPWRASVGSPLMKNPPDGKKFKIPYYEGSLPHKKIFLKFKLENVIKMKNKP